MGGGGRLWAGNFLTPFCRRSVCQVSLDKNRRQGGGTKGIPPAILMNCAAQAFLKDALVSIF